MRYRSLLQCHNKKGSRGKSTKALIFSGSLLCHQRQIGREPLFCVVYLSNVGDAPLCVPLTISQPLANHQLTISHLRDAQGRVPYGKYIVSWVYQLLAKRRTYHPVHSNRHNLSHYFRRVLKQSSLGVLLPHRLAGLAE